MAITKTDSKKVRKALKDAKLPVTIQEIAEHVAAGRSVRELSDEMQAAAAGAVSKDPAPTVGPTKVQALPTELIDAVGERVRSGDASVNADVDHVVTSLAGYRAVAKRYQALSSVKTEALAGDLAQGLLKRDAGIDRNEALKAGEYVAYRTQALVHFMRSSDPVARARWKKFLGRIDPIANPAFPIKVTPTKYLQRETMVGSLRIRYIDVNPDSTEGTILLVHGHASLLEEYETLVPLLAEKYRVIVPDLPGCGYSSKPSRKYTVKYFADTLVKLLDQLHVPKCFVLGGSLGGNLSLRLGLEYGSYFDRLVPWAPAGWIGTDPLLAVGAKLARGMGAWIFWIIYDEQKQTWYSDGWPGKAEALRQSDLFRNEVYCEPYHLAYFDIAGEQVETTMVGRAKDVNVPALLMCGKHDTALDMYDTVKNVLFDQIPVCEFQDKFLLGRHSLASEDTVELSKYALDYLGKA